MLKIWQSSTVSVLALRKTCFEGLMTVAHPAACCLKCRKARSLEPFHLMMKLLRASANCQMQTNTFNNLKLIYCTGKAVERKKQIHVGMEVDNKYDKFVV